MNLASFLWPCSLTHSCTGSNLRSRLFEPGFHFQCFQAFVAHESLEDFKPDIDFEPVRQASVNPFNRSKDLRTRLLGVGFAGLPLVEYSGW